MFAKAGRNDAKGAHASARENYALVCEAFTTGQVGICLLRRNKFPCETTGMSTCSDGATAATATRSHKERHGGYCRRAETDLRDDR